MSVNDRVIRMKSKIQQAAVECGLNLTVYEGKIGFVDQEQRKIVALWTPEYSAADIEGGGMSCGRYQNLSGESRRAEVSHGGI